MVRETRHECRRSESECCRSLPDALVRCRCRCLREQYHQGHLRDHDYDYYYWMNSQQNSKQTRTHQ
jgi:hypothetical protein